VEVNFFAKALDLKAINLFDGCGKVFAANPVNPKPDSRRWL